MKVKVSVTQSCLTFCEPMVCNPPGSSVHGTVGSILMDPLESIHQTDRFPNTEAKALAHNKQSLVPNSHMAGQAPPKHRRT